MLSSETIEGLRITGRFIKQVWYMGTLFFSSHIVKSFVETAKFLLTDANAKLFFLSERISRDPLENYFGQQRARGGRNENPNLQQCRCYQSSKIHCYRPSSWELWSQEVVVCMVVW